MGYAVASGLVLLVGFLVAKKATQDLDAFLPGPPRLSDLLVLVVSLLILLLVDLALSPYFDGVPIDRPCRPPACIVIPIY